MPEVGTSEEQDEAVLRALDIDIRGVGGILSPDGGLQRRISDTEFVDVWGIRYAWTGKHFDATERPLAGATLDTLERYPWPDAGNIPPATIQQMADRARWLREETPWVVCGRHPVFGVMELGCWMCGFDDFLYRMAAEPEFVARFFEIVMDYQLRVVDLYYGALGPYLHFTTSGDDFGSQAGPFVSPAMFRRLVAPAMERRIARTRMHTDAAFFHHTCGSVFRLVPDLIRVGVDILNPIQPGAAEMEPERLKATYGDDLTFYGGIDTQHLLPRGTAEDVADAVRAVRETLGAGGGWVLSAGHTILPEVPAANVVAMFRAGSTL